MRSNVLAPNSAPDPIALVMAAFHAHLNHAVGCQEMECRLFACEGVEEKPGRYVCPCGRRCKTAQIWRKHLRDVHGAPKRHGRWWLRRKRDGELKARR